MEGSSLAQVFKTLEPTQAQTGNGVSLPQVALFKLEGSSFTQVFNATAPSTPCGRYTLHRAAAGKVLISAVCTVSSGDSVRLCATLPSITAYVCWFHVRHLAMPGLWRDSMHDGHSGTCLPCSSPLPPTLVCCIMYDLILALCTRQQQRRRDMANGDANESLTSESDLNLIRPNWCQPTHRRCVSDFCSWSYLGAARHFRLASTAQRSVARGSRSTLRTNSMGRRHQHLLCACRHRVLLSMCFAPVARHPPDVEF